MVKLFGQDLEIQDERLISYLKEIEISENLIGKFEAEKSGQIDQLLSTYITVFNQFDDAMRVCSKKLESEGLTEGVQKIYEKIRLYLQTEKALKGLKRNKILISSTVAKFESENGLEGIFNFKNDFKSTKPQNIVKLLDLNLEVMTELKDEAMNLKADYKIFEVMESYYRTIRIYYVALYHISQSNHLYALSLFRSMKGAINLLNSDLQDSGDFPERQEIVEHVKTINKQRQVLQIKSHLTLLEHEQKKMEELPEQFDELEIEAGKKIKKTVIFFTDD